MSDFARNLRRYRKGQGYSPVELGKMVNYGYTAIANYESGRNEPSFDTLIELAHILGVTTDDLLGADPLVTEHPILTNFKKLFPKNQRIVSERINALLQS